jgi:pyridoxal phosphate enzyme (YggS family)
VWCSTSGDLDCGSAQGRRPPRATAGGAGRRACAASGREPGEITLVVVTKTYPATDIALLAGLGVRDIGESRHQEAAAKHEDLADAGPGGAQLRWHFIGRLQSNKARAVAGYADVVHSIDRVSLLEPLARGARESGRTVECLVQVSLDGDPGRAGARPADVPALAAAIAACDGLVVRGVMAVAPIEGSAEDAFTLLPGLRQELLAEHPGAAVISAGMSGDLEAAVACGATHLRVGTAILGARPPLE